MHTDLALLDPRIKVVVFLFFFSKVGNSTKIYSGSVLGSPNGILPMVANGTVGFPMIPMVPLGEPMVPLALPLIPMVKPMVPLVEPWTLLVYHWYNW